MDEIREIINGVLKWKIIKLMERIMVMNGANQSNKRSPILGDSKNQMLKKREGNGEYNHKLIALIMIEQLVEIIIMDWGWVRQ